MDIKKAAAGLKALFVTAADGLVNELTPKYKDRLVCPIPNGYGVRLVTEGSYFGKGKWNGYVETPIPGGGRVFQDLFENVSNKEVLGKLDAFVDSKTSEAFNQAYIEQIRAPLRQALRSGYVAQKDMAIK